MLLLSRCIGPFRPWWCPLEMWNISTNAMNPPWLHIRPGACSDSRVSEKFVNTELKENYSLLAIAIQFSVMQVASLSQNWSCSGLSDGMRRSSTFIPGHMQLRFPSPLSIYPHSICNLSLEMGWIENAVLFELFKYWRMLMFSKVPL